MSSSLTGSWPFRYWNPPLISLNAAKSKPKTESGNCSDCTTTPVTAVTCGCCISNRSEERRLGSDWSSDVCSSDLAAHLVERREIEAEDRVGKLQRLHHHTRHRSHMRLLHQQRKILLAQRRSAQARHHRRPRRPHHNVRAHRLGPVLGRVQRPMAHAH